MNPNLRIVLILVVSAIVIVLAWFGCQPSGVIILPPPTVTPTQVTFIPPSLTPTSTDLPPTHIPSQTPTLFVNTVVPTRTSTSTPTITPTVTEMPTNSPSITPTDFVAIETVIPGRDLTPVIPNTGMDSKIVQFLTRNHFCNLCK